MTHECRSTYIKLFLYLLILFSQLIIGNVFFIYFGRYSNKNISFGVVDIGHFPNAAEKFGISLPGRYLSILKDILLN